MTKTDKIYWNLLDTIQSSGELAPSRNYLTRRSFTLPTVIFESTPLVTVRKVAWKKAISEMQWFLSGDPQCPGEVLDWWQDQLSFNGCYYRGYSEQLRKFSGFGSQFDQIGHLIDGLLHHHHSRRHVITTWHPAEMYEITSYNLNNKTPTTCHTTIAQFFVSNKHLSMHSYQRSADMLLGVPHNWIQSWALLLWLAAQTGLVADKLIWTFGDAHIYQEPTHIKAVYHILSAIVNQSESPRLIYNGAQGLPFNSSDFELIGEVPAPITNIKPTLL